MCTDWQTILSSHYSLISWNKSVGIATDYGLDDRDSNPGGGWEYFSPCMIGGSSPGRSWNFSLHHRVQTGCGAHQPPLQWVPGALSLGVNCSGREADHSPPSSAEFEEYVELCHHSPKTSSWRGA
jgi:hypothetical protein